MTRGGLVKWAIKLRIRFMDGKVMDVPWDSELGCTSYRVNGAAILPYASLVSSVFALHTCALWWSHFPNSYIQPLSCDIKVIKPQFRRWLFTQITHDQILSMFFESNLSYKTYLTRFIFFTQFAAYYTNKDFSSAYKVFTKGQKLQRQWVILNS